MALSDVSAIDHYEQLGTISWPLSFNNRAGEETLLVSRRNTLTAVFERVLQAPVVCSSLFRLFTPN